jgi:hypothetical protein
LNSDLHPAPFQIDHIIARQHGGSDRIENLAFACMHCNRYKGPNLAGIDPLTGTLAPLFNPRTDGWAYHFRWEGAEIIGTSPTGRATVIVLFMNDPEVVWLRSMLAGEIS